jgi:hypothetical protein
MTFLVAIGKVEYNTLDGDLRHRGIQSFGRGC